MFDPFTDLVDQDCAFGGFNRRPEYLYVRVNGKKKQQKVKVSRESDTVEEFIDRDILLKDEEEINQKNQSTFNSGNSPKLYSSKGTELHGNDLQLLSTGDMVYFAKDGENFDYSIHMEKYEMIKKLGEGGFGKVYLMKDTEQLVEIRARMKKQMLLDGETKLVEDDALCAVKFIKLSEFLSRPGNAFQVGKEAQTLKRVQSKYVVKIHNHFVIDDQIVLVMEYCKGGELKRHFREVGRMSEEDVKEWFRQITLGIKQCHDRNIIHRDLKLENVLFTDNTKKTCKIVDFGIAGFCSGQLKDKTNAGTFKYMPPELLSNKAVMAHPSMDVWGIGMMLFVMLFGFHPFLPKDYRPRFRYDLQKLIQHIINDDLEIPEPVPSDYFKRTSPGTDELTLITDEMLLQKQGNTDGMCQRAPILTDNCKDLLKKMLEKERDDRITINKILEHPWLTSTSEAAAAYREQQLELMKKKQMNFNARENLKRQKTQQMCSAYDQKQINRSFINDKTLSFKMPHNSKDGSPPVITLDKKLNSEMSFKKKNRFISNGISLFQTQFNPRSNVFGQEETSRVIRSNQKSILDETSSSPSKIKKLSSNNDFLVPPLKKGNRDNKESINNQDGKERSPVKRKVKHLSRKGTLISEVNLTNRDSFVNLPSVNIPPTNKTPIPTSLSMNGGPASVLIQQPTTPQKNINRSIKRVSGSSNMKSEASNTNKQHQPFFGDVIYEEGKGGIQNTDVKVKNPPVRKNTIVERTKRFAI